MKDMLFSALVFFVLLQPPLAAPLPLAQASPPDKQEQKQDKKTPPKEDPTQPPVSPEPKKVDEAKPEQTPQPDPQQEKKAVPPVTPPATSPAQPDATQPPVKPDEAKPQPSQSKGTAQRPANQDITAPPVELDQTKPTVYTYDPERAKKEVEVGNYYMKTSKWAQAAVRFEEATKWDPKFSEAYLRLAEAREKKGELSKAVESYRKYLAMDPNSKKKKDVLKSIDRLERELKD
jgi:hypothetical protein